MWNDHFVQINTAAHAAHLFSPGAWPIQAVLYRAVLKFRKTIEEDIDKILMIKVVELTQTGGDLPIVFVPKAESYDST